MDAAIEVTGLSKRYGAKTVVDDVSLAVRFGQVVALLGPNGAGKTTLTECIGGFRVPDAGTVRVAGCDPRRQRERVAARLGVMLQDGGVHQAATPKELLDLFAAFYEHPRDPRDLLERVGLAGVGGQRCRTLSGGQRQRLNLALALVGRPDVVLLDEPTAGMDLHARLDTWHLIAQLRADGAAVLLTTHGLDEAERLADLIAVIDQGRLVALDTPAALAAGDGLEAAFLRLTSPPASAQRETRR